MRYLIQSGYFDKGGHGPVADAAIVTFGPPSRVAAHSQDIHRSQTSMGANSKCWRTANAPRRSIHDKCCCSQTGSLKNRSDSSAAVHMMDRPNKEPSTSDNPARDKRRGNQARGDILPGGEAHCGFARWWRDHKEVEDQIKEEYRTPNQVEQSQISKRTSALPPPQTSRSNSSNKKQNQQP